MTPNRSYRLRNEAAEAGGAPSLAQGEAGLEARLREALIDSRQRYKDLVEVSSDFAWETRADGTFAFVSPRGALGHAAEDLADRPASRFVVSAAAVNPFTTRRPIEAVEVAFRRADGTTAILEASALPLIDEGGAWRGARGVCRDVTEARQREAALARARHTEKLFAEIVAAIRDVVEPTEMLAAAAASIARAFGCGARIFRHAASQGFALAASVGDTLASDDLRPWLQGLLESPEGQAMEIAGQLAVPSRYRRKVNGALCLRRAEGGRGWSEEERSLAVAIASQLGIAIEQIANHEALERLSHTDALTGLLNRRGFFEELGRRFPRVARDRRSGALVYVDLDNFKPVNDRFGHQRGDALLAAVAALLKQATRATDMVARLGGDEFALWLDGVDEAAIRARAELLLRAAQELAPFSAEPAKALGFSIGIAPFRGDAGETLERLIARADAAMYAAKRAGKGSFRIADRLEGP